MQRDEKVLVGVVSKYLAANYAYSFVTRRLRSPAYSFVELRQLVRVPAACSAARRAKAVATQPCLAKRSA